MASARRITPSEAQKRITEGALLVCAYDNEQAFQQNQLRGAISLQEFQAQRSSWDTSKEIIFYCA